MFPHRSILITRIQHCNHNSDQDQDRVWHRETTEKRKALSLPDDCNPWTDRPTTALRGCPPQAHTYNFLHQGINIRFAEHCILNGHDMHSYIPGPNLFNDNRQSCKRQDQSGTITLLGGTRAYSYSMDRILVTQELAFHQGYGDDIFWEDIDLPLPSEDIDNGSKRYRRGRGAVPYAAKGADMIGNAMSLADLELFMYCSEMAAENDVFQHRTCAAMHSFGELDGPMPEGLMVLEADSDFTAASKYISSMSVE